MGRACVISFLLVILAGCGDGKSATPTPPAVTSATGDPRAAIFINKGCPQCHSLSAFGIKSQAEVGPDLGGAYEDVRTRFGMTLEDFLATPTGTMQVVLSSMIKLTPAERDSIIQILNGLHEEREERAEGKH